jgi:hypothetical protein
MLRASAPVLAMILGTAAPADGWWMGQSVTSGWGGPTDDATAQAFVNAGFNSVMGKVEHLELCRAHGLKAILLTATHSCA